MNYEWHDRDWHYISPNESNHLSKLARDYQRTSYAPYNVEVLKCIKSPFAKDVALALMGEIPKNQWSRTLEQVVNELVNRYKQSPPQSIGCKKKVLKMIQRFRERKST